jgi:hypothetical protein
LCQRDGDCGQENGHDQCKRTGDTPPRGAILLHAGNGDAGACQILFRIEQCSVGSGSIVKLMQLKKIKTIVAAAYVVAVIIAAALSGVTSTLGWIALTALTLLPATALLMLWNHPTPSMSESIRSARR